MPVLLGCIADDSTGATDLANTLVGQGMKTIQIIGVPGDDIDPGDADGANKPGKIIINGLREGLKPPTGMHLLPWWKFRMRRSNPFNSKGTLCEKED